MDDPYPLMCVNCRDLHLILHSNKCIHKNVVMKLNEIIERQEEEIEMLKTQLKHHIRAKQMFYSSLI